MPLKFLLAFSTAETDSKFTMIGGKHPKSVIRNLCAQSSEDRVQPDLEVREHHFTINKKDAARPRRIPMENRPTTCNREANRQAKPRFANTSRGVEHRQTSLRQDRSQQHFSGRYLKGQKILQPDWLKRLTRRDAARVRHNGDWTAAKTNRKVMSEKIDECRHAYAAIRSLGLGNQAASEAACRPGSL